jgi:hypothetical protein
LYMLMEKALFIGIKPVLMKQTKQEFLITLGSLGRKRLLDKHCMHI